jgi:hypothetical protein
MRIEPTNREVRIREGFLHDAGLTADACEGGKAQDNRPDIFIFAVARNSTKDCRTAQRR